MQTNINFAVNATSDKVHIRSPDVHHEIRSVYAGVGKTVQVAFSTAGVEQAGIVWVTVTRPYSDKKHASELLPALWKTVSDVCWGGQMANLVLLSLVIFQAQGIAAPSPVKFTCWHFQVVTLPKHLEQYQLCRQVSGWTQHNRAWLRSPLCAACRLRSCPHRRGCGAARRSRGDCAGMLEPARAADAICWLHHRPGGSARRHLGTHFTFLLLWRAGRLRDHKRTDCGEQQAPKYASTEPSLSLLHLPW